MKSYRIDQGTSTVAEFDTMTEMATYLKNQMDPLHRHFCYLYDLKNDKYIQGCMFFYDKHGESWKSIPRW